MIFFSKANENTIAGSFLLSLQFSIMTLKLCIDY